MKMHSVVGGFACDNCERPADEHDLEAARRCLAALSAKYEDELARTCGGSLPAALERARRKESGG